MSKERDEPAPDSAETIQKTFDQLMFEQGHSTFDPAKKRKRRRPTAIARANIPTRLDTDFIAPAPRRRTAPPPPPAMGRGGKKKKKRPKPTARPDPLREALGINSPRAPTPSLREGLLSKARPAGYEPIPPHRAERIYRGRYPGHVDNPSRLTEVAKNTFKAHGLQGEVSPALLEKMRNTLFTTEHTSAEIDRHVQVAREEAKRVELGANPEMPDLEAPSVFTETETDSPRTEPPPPKIVDLTGGDTPQVEEEELDLTGGDVGDDDEYVDYDPDEDAPDHVARDEEHASRTDDPGPPAEIPRDRFEAERTAYERGHHAL